MDVPHHVAIIMDGNGRWARQHKLPRSVGHKKGADRLRQTVREAKRTGIKILTVFAFSTENWNRPKTEISRLFSYLSFYLEKEKKSLKEEGIRFVVFGRRDRLPKGVLRKIESIEKYTISCNGIFFNMAIDYGGRWDIVQASKHIAKDVVAGRLSLRDITEQTFSHYVCLAYLPHPDLLIRTSGELRISNFMLWQLSYSELYFPHVYWPDFDSTALKLAVREYSRRKRRFGTLSE